MPQMMHRRVQVERAQGCRMLRLTIGMTEWNNPWCHILSPEATAPNSIAEHNRGTSRGCLEAAFIVLMFITKSCSRSSLGRNLQFGCWSKRIQLACRVCFGEQEMVAGLSLGRPNRSRYKLSNKLDFGTKKASMDKWQGVRPASTSIDIANATVQVNQVLTTKEEHPTWFVSHSCYYL